MRNTSARISVAFGACLWLLSGCDDVLEACQSCPAKGSGALSVAGDPRLDHSLEAAVRLTQQHRAASQRLTAALRTALGAYGLSQEDVELSRATAEVLWEAAQIDLGRADLDVSFAVEDSECSTDAAILAEVMLACQNHLGCYVSDECRQARLETPKMLCAGLCTGACTSMCQGTCLSASVSDGTMCDGPCLGACASELPRRCAGTCLGTCSGTCSSLSQDSQCQGICSAECTGACLAKEVQQCTGVCYGRCETSVDGPCAEPNACRGRCDGDACFGSCRGLVEPVACDLKYCNDPGDATGLSQCRAAVRDLSVTHVECRRGRVILTPRFNALPAPPDALAVLTRLRILEETLAVALEVEAWAKLLVLGVDAARELDAAWLGQVSEGVASTTQKVDLVAAAVPRELANAPAWALKLRVFALSRDGTSKEYGVVAGVATCVPLVFGFAFEDLDKILPVTVDGSGAVSAARSPGTLLALVDTAEAMTSPLKVR